MHINSNLNDSNATYVFKKARTLSGFEPAIVICRVECDATAPHCASARKVFIESTMLSIADFGLDFSALFSMLYFDEILFKIKKVFK
jgi:hypothetical protein